MPTASHSVHSDVSSEHSGQLWRNGPSNGPGCPQRKRMARTGYLGIGWMEFCAGRGKEQVWGTAPFSSIPLHACTVYKRNREGSPILTESDGAPQPSSLWRVFTAIPRFSCSISRPHMAATPTPRTSPLPTITASSPMRSDGSAFSTPTAKRLPFRGKS